MNNDMKIEIPLAAMESLLERMSFKSLASFHLELRRMTDDVGCRAERQTILHITNRLIKNELYAVWLSDQPAVVEEEDDPDICMKCGQWHAAHNDDGSCVEDGKSQEWSVDRESYDTAISDAQQLLIAAQEMVDAESLRAKEINEWIEKYRKFMESDLNQYEWKSQF